MKSGLKTILVLLILFLHSFSVKSADIKIGLFSGTILESVVFSTVEGEYMLMADGKQLAVIRKGTIFHIAQSGSKLVVSDTARSYGAFSELYFKGISADNIFQLKPVFPALPGKESEDDLTIRIYNEVIQLVNNIDLEKYIPGTVESEGGTSALPEYYKSQAIIARTYALKNFSRHAHEGFNLCDGVHCQAYNGKSRMNREIYNASKLTAGIILADQDGKPVSTAYHSSCGGMTAGSAMVWSRNLSFLTPVRDPFCNKSSNRNWEKTVSLLTWKEYLKQKGINDEGLRLTSSPDALRQKYLDPDSKLLSCVQLREDFNLKSSWFYAETNSGSIIFHGHGYGHGLGLCQQGAMEMARVGYTYVDILMFYFNGLQLRKGMRDEGQGTTNP